MLSVPLNLEISIELLMVYETVNDKQFIAGIRLFAALLLDFLVRSLS